MQIVIDIPDDTIPTKQEIIDTYIHFIDGTVCEVGGYGFMVLPKGHGDLVDRNSITHENTWKEWSPDHGNYFVCTAPAVIEADKENE